MTRFQYALEPVLLTRQWQLNALLQELGECNDLLLQAQKKLAFMQEKVNTAYAEWQALSEVTQILSVQRFAMHNQFIGALLTQHKACEQQLARHMAERDALIDKVVAAQRAVEAVEEHRDEMRARFIKLRLSGEFRIADDQWNTIQAGIAGDAA